MNIKTIKHIAKLSHLDLTEEEMESYAGELTAILDYMKELNEVDTEGVEPVAHAVSLRNVFRDDEHGETNIESAAELINASPEKEEGYVKVRAIL